MTKIKITITKADEKLANSIVGDFNGYKYTYMKQLISRLRIVKSCISDKPIDEQITTLQNVLIVERNIAQYGAERYAELNNEDLFDALIEISDKIEEILKDETTVG